jgi:hypothetical protein
MTPIQTQTVNTLKSEGFQVVGKLNDMVLITRGSDNRFVRHDGSQRRAVDVSESNVRVLRGAV